MGLRGDMRIETASGPIEISILANQTVAKSDFSELAFGWVAGQLTLVELSNIRSIGHEQVFDVELDDGAVIKVSSSSLFVTKAGDRKMAPELHPGDSLLPLYLEEDAHGYPTYRIPGRAVKRKVSRFMAEWKVGQSLVKGTYVEHIDGNRKNYHPDNLKVSFQPEKARRSHKHKLVKAYDAAQALLDECAAASSTMAKIVRRKGKGNHKVVSIKAGRMEEVFTASVRSMGSVAVSGVFLELPS